MDKEEVQGWVKDAVADALKSANLIDGPTHIRHHQFIQEYCEMCSKVKGTAITVFVTSIVIGFISIVVLGFRLWASNKPIGG